MEPPWIAAKRDLRCAIWTSWTETPPLSVQGLPFGKVPAFLTVSSGRAVCVVIDEVASNNPNLQSWFDGLDSVDLAKYPTYLVKEGSTVWQPVDSDLRRLPA